MGSSGLVCMAGWRDLPGWSWEVLMGSSGLVCVAGWRDLPGWSWEVLRGSSGLVCVAGWRDLPGWSWEVLMGSSGLGCGRVAGPPRMVLGGPCACGSELMGVIIGGTSQDGPGRSNGMLRTWVWQGGGTSQDGPGRSPVHVAQSSWGL